MAMASWQRNLHTWPSWLLIVAILLTLAAVTFIIPITFYSIAIGVYLGMLSIFYKLQFCMHSLFLPWSAPLFFLFTHLPSASSTKILPWVFALLTALFPVTYLLEGQVRKKKASWKMEELEIWEKKIGRSPPPYYWYWQLRDRTKDGNREFAQRPLSASSPVPSISSGGSSDFSEWFGTKAEASSSASAAEAEKVGIPSPEIRQVELLGYSSNPQAATSTGGGTHFPSTLEIEKELGRFLSSFAKIQACSDFVLNVQDQLDLRHAYPEKLPLELAFEAPLLWRGLLNCLRFDRDPLFLPVLSEPDLKIRGMEATTQGKDPIRRVRLSYLRFRLIGSQNLVL
ncbi:hypothetical protein Sjap_026685 [Stephania japonica]|uniref:Uncharacterized protein n=1 Tax=Stephania japonica TaxID=461633 RepID=A0AAP0E2A4_9MAGN